MFYVRYRDKNGMEVKLRIDESRLQEVLDAAWRRFGNPDAPSFPTDAQIEASAAKLAALSKRRKA